MAGAAAPASILNLGGGLERRSGRPTRLPTISRRALRRGGTWKADRPGRRTLSPERGRPTRDWRRKGSARPVVRAAEESIPDSLGVLISARSSQHRPRSSFPSSFSASRPEGAGRDGCPVSGPFPERRSSIRSGTGAAASSPTRSFKAGRGTFPSRGVWRNARPERCSTFAPARLLAGSQRLRKTRGLRTSGGVRRTARPSRLEWRSAFQPARRLLKAAASLRLLRALPNDRFALDDLGAAMIGNPAIAAFGALDLLYSDLRDPSHCCGENTRPPSPGSGPMPPIGRATRTRTWRSRTPTLRRIQRPDVHPGACRGNRPGRLSLRPASAAHGCWRGGGNLSCRRCKAHPGPC